MMIYLRQSSLTSLSLKTLPPLTSLRLATGA